MIFCRKSHPKRQKNKSLLWLKVNHRDLRIIPSRKDLCILSHSTKEACRHMVQPTLIKYRGSLSKREVKILRKSNTPIVLKMVNQSNSRMTVRYNLPEAVNSLGKRRNGHHHKLLSNSRVALFQHKMSLDKILPCKLSWAMEELKRQVLWHFQTTRSISEFELHKFKWRSIYFFLKINFPFPT